MHELKRLLSEHFKNNPGKYVFLLILLVVGIVGGMIFSGNVPPDLATSLKSEVAVLMEGIEDGNINEYEIMKSSFLKNLRFFLLIFTGGLSVWLTPLICSVIISYGFSLGFTLSYLSSNFGSYGVIVALSSVLISFLITVPVYMILSVVAFNNSFGGISRRKRGFGIYFLIFGLLFVFSFVAVIIDSFVVPGIITSLCS